jgi:ABC-type dipeptide/oligopeptide/nickel transport system permease subunit
MFEARPAQAGGGWEPAKVPPNLGAPVLISFAPAAPQNITTEVALPCLGVGVIPPRPDGGGLLSDASQFFL